MMDDSDSMMECPYNKSHRVQRSRMQTHLFKCRKNYPHMELKRCPYNANHDVEPADIQRHMETCPDRGSVEAHLVQSASERKPVIMPYVIPIMPLAAENWDNDTNAQTYDPLAKSAQEKILRGLQGASKSKRKTHRAQERLRFTAVAEHGGITGVAGLTAAGTGAKPETKPLAAEDYDIPVEKEEGCIAPLRPPLGTSETFVVPNEQEILAMTLALEKTAPQAFPEPLGAAAMYVDPNKQEIPAKTFSPEKTAPQAWGARSSENVASFNPLAWGSAAACSASSVRRGRQPSGPSNTDLVPAGEVGGYRMHVSVDTGEGLPVPNLERDFPVLGRGRGRLM